ncbi:MAG TPA: GDP-L-fucose synthase [Candidatus Brocadiia bacterium]|nr:GDP-L-fucose synthase [Candidatus Brocadiia bacterium]
MDTPLEKCRICVTGGAGFVGTPLCRILETKGAKDIFVPRSRDYDLTDRDTVKRMYDDAKPDVVIHLAARVGGIGANRDNPGMFFYVNMAMGLHLMEEARIRGVRKFVQVGTICAYPKHTPVPFREEELWNGYPEETNAPYGIAKKSLLVMAQSYRAQYGLNAIYLLPVNLYGPGDNFDLNTSHVIPALIRKCAEAKKRGDEKIVAWGTGQASREFLYVEDCAEAIALAAQHYDKPDPVNVGIGQEWKIRDVLEMIADEVGFQGRIEWDLSKPDGQPRRCLDVSRAEKEFGFRAQTGVKQGLKMTVEWYMENMQASVPRDIG